MAGLGHQHPVAGRERVDQRRFPGAGAGRRDRSPPGCVVLKTRLMPSSTSCAELLELGAAMVDGRDGRSRAARGRARWSGRGSAGNGGRWCVADAWRLLVWLHVHRSMSACARLRSDYSSIVCDIRDNQIAHDRRTIRRARRRSCARAPAAARDRRARCCSTPPRAAATRPTPRSTRSSRSAWWCRADEQDVAAALQIARGGGRAGAAARRRHLAVRPDRRRGAGDRLSAKHLNGIVAFDARGAHRVGRARHRARPAERAAEAARAVVSGRCLDQRAGDPRRHGRQQLLRLALDPLRQHGRTTCAPSTRAGRRRRHALRPMPAIPARATGRRHRELVRRMRAIAGARPRRSQRASRRCCAASAATTSTADAGRGRSSVNLAPSAGRARKGRSPSSQR